MFTMASETIKNLPLEEQFPPHATGRYHKARNILPCFNVLIESEDNVPQVTIDLVIESVGLPNHLLHHTEPSEVQIQIPIRDEWVWLYCYKDPLQTQHPQICKFVLSQQSQISHPMTMFFSSISIKLYFTYETCTK